MARETCSVLLCFYQYDISFRHIWFFQLHLTRPPPPKKQLYKISNHWKESLMDILQFLRKTEKMSKTFFQFFENVSRFAKIQLLFYRLWNTVYALYLSMSMLHVKMKNLLLGGFFNQTKKFTFCTIIVNSQFQRQERKWLQRTRLSSPSTVILTFNLTLSNC